MYNKVWRWRSSLRNYGLYQIKLYIGLCLFVSSRGRRPHWFFFETLLQTTRKSLNISRLNINICLVLYRDLWLLYLSSECVANQSGRIPTIQSSSSRLTLLPGIITHFKLLLLIIHQLSGKEPITYAYNENKKRKRINSWIV